MKAKKTELQRLVAKAKRESLENKFLFLWKAIQGPELNREVQFHPIRKWRFDFAWCNPRSNFNLAIEIEGGSWAGGAHTRGRHFESDCEKYFHAAMMGWIVIRLTGNMINKTHLDQIAETIWTEKDFGT